jgi:hypothetical protein
VGHALRSSGLRRLEASQARISQFTLKLTEEQRRVVHVASSWRSCEDEVEDRRVNAMGALDPSTPTSPFL